MNWVAIVWSGFVASLMAIAFFWAGRSLSLTTFSPTVQVGCFFNADPKQPLTDTLGFLVLLAVGSTVGPALYQTLLRSWDGAPWVAGAVIGGVIGLAIAAALPYLGTISACVRTGRLPKPGRFGLALGRATPAVVVGGNVVYGAIVAAILSAF
jgi:hypothetical protein